VTKRISKKMRISKETLRKLAPSELLEIQGGKEFLANGYETFDAPCETGQECVTRSEECENGTKDCLHVAFS